jgi:hypothetical protein
VTNTPLATWKREAAKIANGSGLLENMSAIAWIWFAIYFPACCLLLGKTIVATDLSERILAVALLLLALDLARMAVVDLTAVKVLRQEGEDAAVAGFFRVTASTIVLELWGLYATWSHLVWGGTIVSVSQLWFNLLVRVQLNPTATVKVEPWRIVDRLPVIGAQIFALVILFLYSQDFARLWLAIILLTAILIYGGIKYGRLLVSSTILEKEKPSLGKQK